MKRLARVVIGAVVVMMGIGLLMAPAVFAEDCGENGVETSVLGGGCVNGTDDGSAIFSVLNIFLRILTYGVGIAGTFGIVIVGIQYLTAKDNAGQMAAAKTRLIAILIGLGLYAVMWALLQWLLPGGIFNGQ